ncbi:uncharacterized protein LOC18448521 [Amborella trichopoda]|uniref:Uncharacterized protein n=1 Tax=Amborella trichopoda TaxID=13333 RepID=U5D3F0_AMBTC|nr:uncharacterized protein LOC18448521 [Amborella trichopoda]ERN20111.1 hypothetical protein AMTR_s00066p00051680 [Amborella trichopoda]|eukprot:XP_006858644.1 uncharacterized protein LOC18448521 [Amborella trichopoda]
MSGSQSVNGYCSFTRPRHGHGLRNTARFSHRTTINLNPSFRRLSVTFASLRRRGRSRNIGSNVDRSDQKLEMVVDLKRMRTQVSESLNLLLINGKEALKDLQGLVTIDGNDRITVSCRRSSLEFIAYTFVLALCIVFVIRVLLKLGSRYGLYSNWGLVRRRDRSLGGREVVVGLRTKGKDSSAKIRVSNSINPLSNVGGALGIISKRNSMNHFNKAEEEDEEKLPKWWPDAGSSVIMALPKDEYQREANRMIRAIMDKRMSGRDVTEDDIIQLRRICKISGAKVSIKTENSRDSLYRITVDFVLNMCNSSLLHPTFVQIDGEKGPQFLAGFAKNIGLEETRAARMVCAAVAAFTRSKVLQAWALEIQGKRSEALEELSKICIVHQIFPPEDDSPEMEMLSQGLEKHLKVEQRERLFKLFVKVCGSQSQTIAEVLRLKPSGLSCCEDS